MMKYILILVILLACSRDNKQLEAVNAKYVDWTASTVTGPVRCGDLEYIFEGSVDTMILTNEKFLNTLFDEIQYLSPKVLITEDDSMNIDIRVEASLEYTSGINKNICIGPAGDIVLNGEIMESNPHLWNLFKEQLYDSKQDN